MVSRVSRVRKNTEQAVETVLTVVASGVGVEEDSRKVIQVRKFEVEPAFVRVSAGVTKATAPYESLRVDVSVTVPCYVEEIATVFKKTEAVVAEFLDETIENYMGEQA